MESRKPPLVVLKHTPSVGETIALSPELLHRLRRVLRLHHGAPVRGLLPGGSSAELVFHDKKGQAPWLEVLKTRERKAEEPSGLTIALSLIKRTSHVDFVIEKGTELGVSGWWSVATVRCADIGLWRAHQRRIARWERIAESAVMQSGRSLVPAVEGVFAWNEFLEKATAFSLRTFGHPSGHHGRPRPTWNPESGSALFLVGPEGGFSKDEVYALREAGFLEYRLGSSVLRSETAALVGAVLLLDAVDRETHCPVL